jgi:hypothetical protein
MKLRPIILSLVAGTLALTLARAATLTNKTYYFDNSSGNIVTQLAIFASPALFSITNGYFFDAALGNYCAMVSTSLPTTYQVCSNIVWNPGGGTVTNRICQSLSSNITLTGRYFVNGAYPVTNKAAAVKTGP